jgi:uncharacterized membrane protein YoaK (UPF0700 family)
MLCLLAWAAGLVDAISYLALGRVFTAMMTGNTVLLALAIGQGEGMAVLRSAIALACFSVGAATGAIIVSRGRSREEWPPSVTAAFAVEAFLLAGFTAVWHVAGSTLTAGTTSLLIALSGLAMGIQAAAVRHLGIPGVATTYLTGTLTSLMAELTSSLRAASGAEPPVDAAARASWSQRIGLLTGVFLVYALGALAGGVLYARSSALGARLPLATLLVVVLNGIMRHRHAGHGSRR